MAWKERGNLEGFCIMEIKNKRIINGKDLCRVECEIGEKTFFMEFPQIYSEYMGDDYDACLLAALPNAMRKKENIKVNGKISYKLYHNLCNYAMNIISTMISECEPITIEVESFYYTETYCKNKGNATGLSCGVDSLCCVEDYYYTECANHKLTHVLNSTTDDNMSHDAYRKRLNNAREYASNTDLNLIDVTTNVNDFFKGIHHNYSHVFRNLSITLFFQKLFGRFYYSSTYSYKDIKIGDGELIAYADPILIPLLSTENIDFISHGCQYTRIEKTKKIMHMDLVKKHLDVCVNHKYANGSSKKLNCGKCWKCHRTMLVLDFYNLLEEYEQVFDHIRYFKRRKNRIFNKLNKSDPLSQEIIDLYSKK